MVRNSLKKKQQSLFKPLKTNSPVLLGFFGGISSPLIPEDRGVPAADSGGEIGWEGGQGRVTPAGLLSLAYQLLSLLRLMPTKELPQIKKTHF